MKQIPPIQLPLIDHFAFRVNEDNFEIVRQRLDFMGIEYEIQDHRYFRSLYVHGSDGHIVELTTPMVSQNLDA
jgi:hypothetical protein